MKSFSKSLRMLLLIGLTALLVTTGCSSKPAGKPLQSPSVTADQSSATQNPPEKKPTPVVNASRPTTQQTPSKRAVSEPNHLKTSPKPTTSASPTSVQFGVPLPWEDTPPSKLAEPWTLIAPSTTSTTIAIVQLDPNSILIAANRGLFRTASVITGVTGFRVFRVLQNGDLVDRVYVNCPNGAEVWVGFFAGVKTWNTNSHPSTYTLRALGEPIDACSTVTNTD